MQIPTSAIDGNSMFFCLIPTIFYPKFYMENNVFQSSLKENRFVYTEYLFLTTSCWYSIYKLGFNVYEPENTKTW